jgi:hypothetical protein
MSVSQSTAVANNVCDYRLCLDLLPQWNQINMARTSVVAVTASQ